MRGYRTTVVVTVAFAALLAASLSVARATRPQGGLAATRSVQLGIWWWGEQEAAGSQKWLIAAQAAYHKKHPSVTFKNNLLSTDAYLPALAAAAAAKKGPTIEYLWGGAYTMDPVWKSQIVPVSDYVGMNEARHYINKEESTWQGKIWTAAWYLVPAYPIIYNKEVFSRVGLDPAAPPRTWNQLLSACDTSAAKGVPLIGAGVKDTYGTGRFEVDFLMQEFDNVAPLLKAVVGDSKFTTAPFIRFFTRWQELINHKCFPDDVKSLAMYDAQQLVPQGKAGLTFITGAEISAYVKSIGAARAGVFLPPRSGNGALAGRLGSTSQVFAITKWASKDQKKAAADFIKFMHTPAQLAAYYRITGVPPADDRFNFNSITVPQVATIYKGTVARPAPEIENFRPHDIGYNGIDQAMVQMVTGQIKSPQDAAAFVDSTAQRWREANQLVLKLFKQWAAEKIAAAK